MNKKTILVTGGAGYIGSHTAKALFESGYLPVVYDNLSMGHKAAVQWGPFVEGDLRDSASLDACFKTYRPDAVIHFAADALVVESMQNPGKYYFNNIGSTISLLEAMQKHNVSKFVFSSTCAIYGNPIEVPVSEEYPVNPINPYGRSKLMCEEIIHDFERTYGIEAVILRYFNAAGADFDLEIGENHSPETHLIPSIIQAALGVREKIVVYGDDFPTKDKTAIRDFIHVKDLALAHIQALFLKGSHTINLGTGKGYSVLEIIEEVKRFSQKKLKVCLCKKRAGEPAILVADNYKAKTLLNWSPKFSSLSLLIQSAYLWHEKLLTQKQMAKI